MYDKKEREKSRKKRGVFIVTVKPIFTADGLKKRSGWISSNHHNPSKNFLDHCHNQIIIPRKTSSRDYDLVVTMLQKTHVLGDYDMTVPQTSSKVDMVKIGFSHTTNYSGY